MLKKIIIIAMILSFHIICFAEETTETEEIPQETDEIVILTTEEEEENQISLGEFSSEVETFKQDFENNEESTVSVEDEDKPWWEKLKDKAIAFFDDAKETAIEFAYAIEEKAEETAEEVAEFYEELSDKQKVGVVGVSGGALAMLGLLGKGEEDYRKKATATAAVIGLQKLVGDNVFEALKTMEKAVNGAGGELYVVGGFVRDALKGLVPHDIDLVTTGLTEGKFLEKFPDAIKTGNLFPVFRVTRAGEEFEIAFARTEQKTGLGHNGFKVLFDEKTTLKEDLIRRDLTVNSMAMDLNGKVIDYFGGMVDMRNKILRPTSEAFKEDPLRALRIARQAGKLEFEIAPEGYKAMEECAKEIKTLPKERIFEEFQKVSDGKTADFFKILDKGKCLEEAFPQAANPNFQKNLDVLEKIGDSVKNKDMISATSFTNCEYPDFLSAKGKKIWNIMNQLNGTEADAMKIYQKGLSQAHIDDWANVLEARFGERPWWCNEEIYKQVTSKVEIPSGLEGRAIKNFMDETWISRLESLRP